MLRPVCERVTAADLRKALARSALREQAFFLVRHGAYLSAQPTLAHGAQHLQSARKMWNGRLRDSEPRASARVSAVIIRGSISRPPVLNAPYGRGSESIGALPSDEATL